MATTTTNATVKTKLTKDSAAATQTALTIEWDISQEEIIKLAQKTVVIAWQANARVAGTIPSADTVSVKTLFTNTGRKGPGPLTAERAVAKLGAEELMNAMLANGSISKKQYDAMLKARNSK